MAARMTWVRRCRLAVVQRDRGLSSNNTARRCDHKHCTPLRLTPPSLVLIMQRAALFKLLSCSDCHYPPLRCLAGADRA